MIIVQVRNRKTGRKAEIETRSAQQAMRVKKMLWRLDGTWYSYGDYFARKVK